ncbi:hypothetical protein Tco_1008656 [Tanacetum coccineum]
MYGDLNINLERRDAEMTDAQVNQDTEDVHVTLTAEPPVVQHQSSSVSSDLVSKFINPTSDTGIDSILNPNIQSHTLVNVPVSVTAETPSSDTTIPLPPIPITQPLQQTPEFTTTTTIPITNFPQVPNFASLFGFEQKVSALETEMTEFKQTSQFADAVSSISGIVDNYLASKIKDAMDVAIQLQSNKLREEAQAENEEFLSQIDSNIKAIIKDQVKAQVSKILPKVEKYVTESLRTEVSDVQKTHYNALIDSYNSDKDLFTSYGDVITLKRGRDDQDKDEDPFESKFTSSLKGASRSQPKSSGKSAQAEEHDHKLDDLEEHSHQEFNIGDDDVILVRETLDDASRWNTLSSPTLDREWHKTKTADKRPPQQWISQLAQASGNQSSFNEFWLLPSTSLPS